MRGDHVCRSEHFGHRIGGGDSGPGDLKGGQIDEVVADKHRLLCTDSEFFHHRFQAFSLVTDTGVPLSDAQFLRTQVGALAGSAGDPDDGDTLIEEATHAGSVGDEETFRFAAVGVDRHPVVGEDSVHIEGEQSGPQGGQMVGNGVLHDNSLACDP